MSDDPPHTTPLIDPPTGELPVGTSLNGGQYKIKRVIASGGFGITYLAQDNLRRDVALKECFPLGLAMRQSGKSVGAASVTTADSFATARDLFLREARLLAALEHPNVVHVQTLFEENGTAYMAMDFIHGHDLHTVMRKFPERLTPEKTLELSRTLLGALDYLHEEECLHRDIKPSNIRIDRFGTPILIDFGAARQETKNRTRIAGSFRVVSDGYSPNEFYISGAEQGPPSDLYSLAATLYHVIAGKMPAQADARAQQVVIGERDPYEPIAGKFPEQDPALLEMIDRAMSMSIRDRPANAKEWLEAIAPAPPKPLAPPLPPDPPSPPPRRRGPHPIVAAGLGALATAVVGGLALSANPSLWAGPTEAGAGDDDSPFAAFTDRARDVADLRRELTEARSQIQILEAELAAAREELGQSPAQPPQATSAEGDVNWVGTWSLIAQCPDDVAQSIGTSRVFGTLFVTDQSDEGLAGTYRNNLGNTARISGEVFGTEVLWTFFWDHTDEITLMDWSLRPDRESYTGTDHLACELSGTRRS